MAYQTLLYTQQDRVGVVTLNRPDRLNAINRVMLRELATVCERIQSDDEIRAVVVTGAGGTFSSGFDLKEQAESPPKGVAQWRKALRDDFGGIMRFWHMPKPTIAAVGGHVLAGGFEMMLACDLAVAAEDTLFGEPELLFGAGIVAMLVPWFLGPKMAKELILLADDRITAERALALGLVNRIVPAGCELETALTFARRLAAMDPVLVRETKRALNRTYHIMGMSEALEMALDIDLQIEGQGTDTKREFLRIARKKGLRAALAWRNGQYDL